ncbi:hypothetical protein ERO13_D08G224600v2 [Gossypium hirsutum]|uniref:Ribosomal protein S11 n=5 Tax=Gossypium TaxID=3633 RepID=A0A5J5QIH8_GOSBA|nr:probable ribosomal protein S11, mitochondrial [Gossypium hirsutum]KAB2018675.1 hypothetical protein ES319_D08G246100v1 [Gossypium barbadense]TYG58880.1 hypothetical protein ES288_D08G258000v1 [Gossypium darwinii]TYH59935.1 hypothetical protein ES332_D08G257200v1 [Gossypium tomentosum]TYI70816.1 hypothetical protein E1A91_D08G249100v1 [Gossypium mustelinum]KAG4135579.1 hypothetical protein ERO13_D08G224600v2 [Gossypium hirsutum]
MHPLSSIRQLRHSSTSALLQRFSNFNWVCRASSNRPAFLGGLKSFSAGAHSSENVGTPEKNFDQQTMKDNVSATYASTFQNFFRPLGEQSTENVGNLGRNLDQQAVKENVSARYASAFRDFTRPSGQTEFRSGGNYRSMDVVMEAIDGDRRANYRGSQFRQDHIEQNEHFAHIKIMRNNTFVTVTDSNGNKKCGASAGMSGLLGGTKVSKYATEAVAEYAGRKARKMGIKSVVVRVKGFTHFKKKKQAILSFREGFKNPIVFIEDVTRHPHNGCRLPKKRRI